MQTFSEYLASPGVGTDWTPLTFQQLWLWNLLQKFPGWNCRIPFVLRIRGALERHYLQEALNTIIQRHESLRTRIPVVDGVPTQQIDVIDEIVLRNAAGPVDSDAQLHEHVQSLLNGRVDLCAGSLFEARLIERAHRDHVLVVSLHHLITDAFSFNILFRELWSLYVGLCKQRVAPLPKISGRYADYAAWQHATNAEWQHAHAAYWRERLNGADRIRLPHDAAGRNGNPCLGSTRILMDRGSSIAVHHLAQTLRTVPATIMLAAYACMVRRWAQQRDFVLPFNFVGRHAREHRYMTGYLAQVLYLRVQMDTCGTFSTLVKHIGSELRRAVLHQDYGRVVAQVPELLRGSYCQWLSWSPAELTGAPIGELAAQLRDSIEVEPFPFRFGIGQAPLLTDLALDFWDGPDGIGATVNYRTDYFEPDTVVRLMQEIGSSLEEFARNPDNPL